MSTVPPGRRRVLVTGSRKWFDTEVIRDALAGVWHPDTVLVSGHCGQGADQLAEDCWATWGGVVHHMPANWDDCTGLCPPTDHRRRRRDGSTYCPLAGHHRNQAMVDLGATVCLAFIRDNSPGATDCASRAGLAGIPTVRYAHPPLWQPPDCGGPGNA